MATSVMNQYQVGRRNFPLTLYRVDYPGSQTTYSDRWGFEAAGTFTPRYENGLRRAVENHLDWGHREHLSPFISTLGNREHAFNWARDWSERHDQETCHVYEIALDAGDVTVFRVVNLVNRLNVATSLHRSMYHSEYLCFRHIPPESIVRGYAVSSEGDDSESDFDDEYY